MALTLGLICFAILCLLLVLRTRRAQSLRELDRHSITAESLHSLITSDPQTLVFDVRQPLDLLAYPEIIPGARRIPPEEVIENPTLIPKEKDAVVYCTCPSDKTSRSVLRKALPLNFSRLKFLRGGLAAWKASGYPVEPYRESFHLYTRGMAAHSK
jgi:rhodanese-related sulfurtransferase